MVNAQIARKLRDPEIGELINWLMNQEQTVFSELMSSLPARDFGAWSSAMTAIAGCAASPVGTSSCPGPSRNLPIARIRTTSKLHFTRRAAGYITSVCAARSRTSRWPDANEAHDWRIFADLTQLLISIARPLYIKEPIGLDFGNAPYALDSTTSDLCLRLFPWAHFRSITSAVTMKILTVLTSRDELGSTGNMTGFWLEELAAPYYVFKDTGGTSEPQIFL